MQGHRRAVRLSPRFGALSAAAAVLVLAAASEHAHAQTWQRLSQNAPDAVNQLILLTDGTVMAGSQPSGGIGNGWFKLTPDSRGSYVNGTWSTMPSMQDTRLYYSSQVLRDGRVLVAGGEYGTGNCTSELYNPWLNRWTTLTVPTTIMNPDQNSPAFQFPVQQGFRDAMSGILPNGSVLFAPVGVRTLGQTVLYNPTTNVWSNGPNLFRGDTLVEASWAHLPDDSYLSIDPGARTTQRYIPSLNRWVSDAVAPVDIYDAAGTEMGAAVLLADGRAWFLGGTGHTAFYTPSGTNAPGVWTAGPDFPNGLATPDAPAAVLTNGKVLCAVSPPIVLQNGQPVYPTPTSFYEFDPLTNNFTIVRGPNGFTEAHPVYTSLFLQLPDGGVLYSHFTNDLYIYRPAGPVLASARPQISSVSQNLDGSYHLTGTGLNGVTEGASYGDDAQMRTNFPIVRLTSQTGTVVYARTFNFSTSLATGNRILSTDFYLPPNLLGGSFSLVVTANGIASDPINFVAPQPGACCIGTMCFLVGGGFCPGGILTTLPSCSPSPCTQTGACCSITGVCTVVAVANCTGSAQSYGLGTTCTPSPCPMTAGACCSGTACSIAPSADCLAPSHFAGVGVTCGAGSNPVVCCPANINQLDGLTVQDIFDFLALWFARDPRADFNTIGGVTLQDLFDFLSAYFVGCT